MASGRFHGFIAPQGRGILPVPGDERWFWTERWQAGEREVDEHGAEGRVTNFGSAAEFVASLDET